MLTLKNICKTYSTKGGVNVKALDDVSLTFPEKGMVFLLGRSGSGKSTLLNVCGGLDKPDSGEIIICGRSSATFTGSDFDSYRNTFVGFIFQEYNILNEFTVEENLALALELQGRGKDKEKVNELLRQVDMEGYGKRKPNTLSGGQKQRIAIARALIKDPRIIMADEPTGALDSNTGKQVLDTLKELSKTRLVIVVSHDRDFAEIYGDRVIELKDGKVISDVSKTAFAPEKMGENISVIAGGTLSIKSGKSLSDDDLESIRRYVAEADNDVLISRSFGDITSFKRANRIADDDSSERFAATDTSAVDVREYSPEESTLVRSKLPIKKAIKMGASSLKVKKFRLFLTIFLSVIAFIMFGIFSTLMTYNGDKVLINSYAQSGYDTIDLSKTYKVVRTSYRNGEEQSTYTYYNTTYFNDDDITALRSELGHDVIGIMQLSTNSSTTPANVSASSSNSRTLYASSIVGVGYADEDSSYRNGLIGEYPAANDEIAISKWYYQLLKTQTFYDMQFANDNYSLNTEINVQSESDVIGKYLYLKVSTEDGTSYAAFKITGIYNAGDIPAEYDGWDDAEKSSAWDDDLLSGYEYYLNESMHRIALVSESFCADYAGQYGSTVYTAGTYTYNKYFSNTEYYYSEDYSIWLSTANAYDASSEDALQVYWFGEEKTELSGNEAILNIDQLSGYLDYLFENGVENNSTLYNKWSESYNKKYESEIAEAKQKAEEYLTEYNNLIDSGSQDTEQLEYYYNLYNQYQMTYDAYDELANIKNISFFPFYADKENYAYASYSTYISTEAFIDAIIDFVQNYATASSTIKLCDYYDGDLTLDVVGFHLPPSGSYADGTYLSADVYESIKDTYYSVTTTNYVRPDDAIYRYAYVKYDGSTRLISSVVDLMNATNADDSSLSISSTLYSEIAVINELVDILSSVFLYTGIALAAFAALLLYNFISISITNKTHEIGVLRAVGARGWDVFKIFFAEAVIITLICLVISLIATLALIAYLNYVLTSGLGFPYVLFSFGIVSLLMMLAVAAIVAFLGTFIPVFRISRKKPVDSMRTV